MEIFKYGGDEIKHLSERDKELSRIINELGILERPVTPNLFEALVECIVGQQISTKAAVTVNQRLKDKFDGAVTPEKIAQANHFMIQECGTTLKKASYIKIAADAILYGKIKLNDFPAMSDEEIINQLTQLPGIGVWTAEMLMIVSLQRPDIISFDDLIIRRSIIKLYNLKELTKEQFEEYRERYSPYGSIASLYLWAYGRSDLD
ncbi:MAG TPA: DNA-3-methyladenine glycosylase [Prolixibacteraceae bacterium]